MTDDQLQEIMEELKEIDYKLSFYDRNNPFEAKDIPLLEAREKELLEVLEKYDPNVYHWKPKRESQEPVEEITKEEKIQKSGFTLIDGGVS